METLWMAVRYRVVWLSQQQESPEKNPTLLHSSLSSLSFSSLVNFLIRLDSSLSLSLYDVFSWVTTCHER